MWAKLKAQVAAVFTGRMSLWMWVTVALVGVVAVIAPLKIGVMLGKLVLVTLAAWLGYWIDRALFPYARPHEFDVTADEMQKWSEEMQRVLEVKARAFESCMMRRAVVVVGVMLAVGLGL